MKKVSILAMLFLCSDLRPVWADLLLLDNGDRVTGTIVELTNGSVTMESNLLGTISAPFESVIQVQSDAPVFLTFSDGQVVLGALQVDQSEAIITTADAGALRIPRASVAAIRSQARQEAFRLERARQLDPGIGDLWAASVDGALSLTEGNSETRSVSVAVRAARNTLRDRTSLYLTSLFASNTTSGTRLTTANAVRGGARYEVELNERLFTFGFTDLEFDRFQSLDLRLVLGGGLGLEVMDTERTSFQVFGGGSSNQEFFDSGVRRKTGESIIGEEWTLRINDRTAFTQRLAVYPNLSDLGEYRVNFDASTTTEINDWLSWQLTLSDRYLTNPLPGKRSNDLLFTTGVRITLGNGDTRDVGPSRLDF